MKKILIVLIGVLLAGCSPQPPEYFIAAKIAKNIQESNEWEVVTPSKKNDGLFFYNKTRQIQVSFYEGKDPYIMDVIFISTIKPFNSIKIIEQSDAFDVLYEPLMSIKDKGTINDLNDRLNDIVVTNSK